MENIILITILILAVFSYLFPDVYKKEAAAINKRLAIYKEMLEHYEGTERAYVKQTGYPYWSSTREYFSMCLYLTNVQGTSLKHLKELRRARPLDSYLTLRAYWFSPNLVEPRIKCIKKAIRRAERKLNNPFLLAF